MEIQIPKYQILTLLGRLFLYLGFKKKQYHNNSWVIHVHFPPKKKKRQKQKKEICWNEFLTKLALGYQDNK